MSKDFELYDMVSQMKDWRLSPCPECGAGHCIPVERRGPTVLRFAQKLFRVVCLACWNKSKYGDTAEAVIEAWNNGNQYETLRELRARRGITVERLAEMARVGTGTISDYENQRSRMAERTRRKIATALGVALNAF